MDHEETEKARVLDDTLEFIGLRAQATTVGLIQLCTELVASGVLNDEALERIKEAIFREIAVTHLRGHDRAEFERTLKQRLDVIFSHSPNTDLRGRVGTAADLEAARGSRAARDSGDNG